MYELREGRKMRPKTFAAMLSNLLYERRFGPFFVEPIVAGIDPATKEPFICSMDLIGCKTLPEDFVVGGTSDDQLYGMFGFASPLSRRGSLFCRILNVSPSFFPLNSYMKVF